MLKNVVSSVAAVVFACAVSPCLAADGQPDPGFGAAGFAYLTYDSADGNQLRDDTMVVLADGKLLFGGARNKIIQGNPDPDMRAMLARMNADGSVDTTFGSDASNPGVVILPDLVVGTAMQVVEAIAPQGDGSVIVAGTAQAFGPLTGFVVKVDAAGVPDPTFGTDGVVLLASAYFHAIGVTDRGRILVAGERRTAGVTSGIVVALDPDGQFDTTFGGGDGIAELPPGANGEGGYLNTLLVANDGGAIVGGAYESYGSGMGTDFSLARFTTDGVLDTTFSGAGWRNFPLAGDASTGNSIARLLAEPDNTLMFVGSYQDATTGSNIVLGHLLANGDSDPAFGAAATPGFQRIALLPDAGFRNPTAFVRQDDGKLLVSVSYGSPGRQDFLAFRTTPDGALDAGFGNAGVADFDLAPNGVYSDSEAIALQDGKPIIAGFVKRSSDPSSTLVELAAVRLTNGSGNDRIFSDGFEGAAVPVVSNYDDLTEGFLGTSYQYNGVSYHDVNGIGGVFPDGSTFTAADVGDQLIIENATDFFANFPDFGSSPNTLTFGTSYVPGPNLSIGAFVQATMDLDQPANAVSVDLAYYENGPWGGIEFHLDAYRNGSVVGSTSLTIANGGGRDNATTSSLAISGVEFDSLKMYATYAGQPSAPRLMIDNLSLTPAAGMLR